MADIQCSRCKRKATTFIGLGGPTSTWEDVCAWCANADYRKKHPAQRPSRLARLFKFK